MHAEQGGERSRTGEAASDRREREERERGDAIHMLVSGCCVRWGDVKKHWSGETGDEGLAFESQIYSALTCSRREDGCPELADYYS